MARLFQQIICKTKSFNVRLFKRFSLKPTSIFPITTLKSKLSTSKRAFNSLYPPLPSIKLSWSSVPLFSIELPFTKETIKHKPHQKSNKKERNRKTKNQNRDKYVYIALATYLFAEMLFYLRCRYLEQYARNISVDIVRPNISHERCEHLLDLALKYAGLYDGGYKGWLKLWFNECDINDLRSDNILELVYWGFFVENYVKHDENINNKELQWREEFVRNSLHKLETQMDHVFPEGYNEEITERFNTKTEINIDYHSLTLYLIVTMIQLWSNMLFKYYYGFKYEWINDMKVWYKRINGNNNNTNKALLFLHGIGIGLGPYYLVLEELLNKKDNDMLCVIEIPYVTMDILHLLPWPFSKHSYITNKLPAKISDYVSILGELENRFSGLSEIDWTIVGHSYGTMIASNMYLQIEDEKKPRLLLLDPVCFCLSHPSTVSAFVTDIDAIVDNDEFMPKLNARKLLAKELMISLSLRKYFHWYDLVLYPEQIVDNKQHIVVTSTKDNIVPVQLIGKGIAHVNNDTENDITIIHHTVDGSHGEWLWDKECVKNVLRAL